ncbi:hypothetical protein J2Y44_002809 [Dyadobacter sp. BE32]|nr:hypothetical protein [Dyadobacter sp. BE242]MDR7215779.1 hypothetical protein [Dyadobacter sp. BE31]MDR7263315.1 hypothetical protein [Dyadobacter sp. BE32]
MYCPVFPNSSRKSLDLCVLFVGLRSVNNMATSLGILCGVWPGRKPANSLHEVHLRAIG